MKTGTIKERDLQKAAAKYLKARRRLKQDIEFTAVKNEIRQRGEAARREIARQKQEGMTEGAMDLIIWIDHGPVVAVELKVGSRPQSDNQKEFERSLTRLGHAYELVRAKHPDQMAGLMEDLVDRWAALRVTIAV